MILSATGKRSIPVPRHATRDGDRDHRQREQFGEDEALALRAIYPPARPEGGREGSDEGEHDCHEVGPGDAEGPGAG